MQRGWRAFVPVLAFLAFTAVPAARAQSPVEVFVQQSIDRGIAVLKDKSLDEATRRKALAAFLTEVLDTRKMALFMLGPARNGAATDDVDRYAEIYGAFTIASYQSQLNGYGGQTLKVTGSIERAPGDYIVDAVVIDPSAPNDPSPLPVGFRVARSDGKFGFVDASVAGIWLGLAQRADFAGYLSQHGQSVPALAEHLREMMTGSPATAAAK